MARDLWSEIYDSATSEWFWLPPGVTWKEMDNPSFANFYQLKYGLFTMVALLVLRILFEWHILPILGRKFGIKSQAHRMHKKPPHDPVLEKVYRSCRKGKVPPRRIPEMAKSSGKSEREVERWLRRRRLSDTLPLMVKFVESCWKVIFYTASFGFGCFFLYRTPWVWDMDTVWVDFPFQPVTNGAFLYYLIELGYYMGSLLTMVYDVKRKDFGEMMIHHIATVILIVYSYSVNYWRIGCLVMLTHDIGDILLELAKALKYARCHWLADSIFVVFAVVFFVSRLVYFPFLIYQTLFRCVHSFLGITLWEVLQQRMVIPTLITINLLLIVLFILHCLWASVIINMSIKLMHTGQIVKDDRSESEDDASGEELEGLVAEASAAEALAVKKAL